MRRVINSEQFKTDTGIEIPVEGVEIIDHPEEYKPEYEPSVIKLTYSDIKNGFIRRIISAKATYEIVTTKIALNLIQVYVGHEQKQLRDTYKERKASGEPKFPANARRKWRIIGRNSEVLRNKINALNTLKGVLRDDNVSKPPVESGLNRILY